jgi:hypothetical protein
VFYICVRYFLAILIATATGSVVSAQSAKLVPADPVVMPGSVDSNSPAFWQNGQLQLFNSTWQGPTLSTGDSQLTLGSPQNVQLAPIYPWPFWIESVWRDPDGPVYAWYHQEFGPCPDGNYLAVPRIGAAISYDGGQSFVDMGSILTSSQPVDCNAQNGYTAGGVGDFSVILDQAHQYFYILYTSYGGQLQNEGICIARMPYGSRRFPNGAVQKYYNGAWSEPGIDGQESAVFPAVQLWQQPDTNSFWGPSVHWNTYLQKYVVLLNHSCCATGYPQDGIFITYNGDLSDPTGFTDPVRLADDPGWYPQVLGFGPDGTDQLAGQTARFYIAGKSQWRIVFSQ